jgi:hypothetical protein
MAEEVRVEQPQAAADEAPAEQPAPKKKPVEIGGPKGPEPTRYGDWERGGICVDF